MSDGDTVLRFAKSEYANEDFYPSLNDYDETESVERMEGS